MTQPGKITQTRIAMLPDGQQIAGAALDANRRACTRWCDGSAWTPWAPVAARAAHAADVDGAPVAYVVATPGASAIGRASRGRGIHKLTPDGTVTAMAV